MEHVDLGYLRKQWKQEFGYYWDKAHQEIDEYFEMLEYTKCVVVNDLKSKSGWKKCPICKSKLKN